MPTVKVYDMKGNITGDVTLSDKIFAAEINKDVLHAVVRAYLMNQRQGTQSALTRAEVSGGGRKPWRQKGTGRARQGSTRSPQWTKGGVVFAPKPRSYRLDINKKVKKIAMFSALTSKVIEESFIVVDKIVFDEFKTKKMVEFLSNIGIDKKAMIITAVADKMVYRSASNIPGIKTSPANSISVYDILKYDKLIIAKDALAKIEEVYA